MNTFLVFAIVVLLLQVGLFFMIRKKKKEQKRNSIVEKYNIKSASDAFRLIQDNSVPQEDRDKIELLYKGEE
ncbi:hypothetical protein FNH22_12045 [Fulvivirga sp. M361]|uniref:hypothetical protein n=1 Tax=Fulvivirga sp. M361 TaxID=2594266 RepID=UPI00117BC8DF|nr:hypothetical protein [Fulvivirga sp. M361]TRX58606.1 hypothetical protein FNH22_12045 [Fulvivirga sp. M361]